MGVDAGAVHPLVVHTSAPQHFSDNIVRLPRMLYHAVMPAARLMDRLRFTSKLITIGLIFVAAIAVLTLQLLPLLRFNIDFIDKERRGLLVAEPLGQAISAVADLRAGAGSQASAAFEQAWKRVGEWHQTHAEDMPQSESMQRIEAQWKTLGSSPSVEETDAFMVELITLGEAVADASNLTLDPEINAYVLMDAVFFKHPGAANQLAQLRDQGVRLNVGTATDTAVSELGRAVGMLQVAKNLLDRATWYRARHAGKASGGCCTAGQVH